ncbi:endonuclease domain-containing protein [Microbacterium sp. C7(2022)]|uniref:endonuclease domain-containing protein n=1 Tax=Microbacterium sp. C7(2022) TaxID=2992759 RepID=UPI00237C18AF|nr:hypothetical protein [Microbacterium sp. C7(2022)]MDE0547358.1 hypothetical protein [Microbacterium sp. C7(2022)]
MTLLQELGVFVQDAAGLHVQLEPDASRLPRRSAAVTAHWRASMAPPACLTVPIVEALAQAVRCQEARAAIATLDSALHLGIINKAGLATIFARLPRRYGVLKDLVDGRCESGPETLVRLVLRTLECQVDLQVSIDGIGRVDFLVDGWLIIECDSQAFHSDWAARKRDLRRDRMAAERGYVTLRLLAEDIMWHRDDVRGAIAGLLRRGQFQR